MRNTCVYFEMAYLVAIIVSDMYIIIGDVGAEDL